MSDKNTSDLIQDIENLSKVDLPEEKLCLSEASGLHDIVASLAIPIPPSKAVLSAVRESIPNAFESTETWIIPIKGNDDAYVAAWKTDDYYSLNIHPVITDIVYRLCVPYCLIEISNGGASFAKDGLGYLENFFIAKRVVTIADEFKRKV